MKARLCAAVLFVCLAIGTTGCTEGWGFGKREEALEVGHGPVRIRRQVAHGDRAPNELACPARRPVRDAGLRDAQPPSNLGLRPERRSRPSRSAGASLRP
jgi:hypothetical protein